MNLSVVIRNIPDEILKKIWDNAQDLMLEECGLVLDTSGNIDLDMRNFMDSPYEYSAFVNMVALIVANHSYKQHKPQP